MDSNRSIRLAQEGLFGRGDILEYFSGRDEWYIYFLMGTPRYIESVEVVRWGMQRDSNLMFG